MALDDPVDDGQAQTRALARRLGGEKGLEDLVPDLRGDAATGVGELQDHAFAMPGGTAGDGDHPGAAHGVGGVKEQVGEDLLELAGVPDDLRQPGVQVLFDLDIVEEGLVADQFHAGAQDSR